jgi:hypothetical protein
LTQELRQGILTIVSGPDDLWQQWRRLTKSASPDPLEVAKLASTFERYFDAVKTEAVKAARASGHSWEEVATTLGTSRQSAWERYRLAERTRAAGRWWPVPLPRTGP